MFMEYQISQPPFTLKFREMSKQELLEYGRWFQASTHDRLAQLERIVRATPGYEAWPGTSVGKTLDMFGCLFAGEVATRPRTAGEIAALQAQSALLSGAPEVDLTNRSFSLAIDVGMFLARSLERAYPHLRWTQLFDNKKFADYGQPLLMGFGPVPLNPVRIALTLAYAIAAGKQDGKRLGQIYEYWAGQAAKQVH
jgi:hypothetical protein